MQSCTATSPNLLHPCPIAFYGICQFECNPCRVHPPDRPHCFKCSCRPTHMMQLCAWLISYRADAYSSSLHNCSATRPLHATGLPKTPKYIGQLIAQGWFLIMLLNLLGASLHIARIIFAIQGAANHQKKSRRIKASEPHRAVRNTYVQACNAICQRGLRCQIEWTMRRLEK